MTGRKKSQTDAKGNTTTYTYDALDRLIQTDFPFADGITSKQKSYYDAASNLILAKNQNNAVNDAESYTSVAYSYDNMNRLTAVSGDTTPVSYTYDLAGRMLTHTTGIGSNLSVNRYTYDVNGFVTSTTDALGNTEAYTYDYAGNVKTKQDANGNRTQNTYGIFGLKQSDIFETDTKIPTISYQYIYNSLGWNTQKDLYENGVKTQGKTNTFDAFGRITQEALTNGTQKVYTYDKNSNRTGFTLSKDGTVEMQTAYTYDDLNRLKTITNGTHTSQYTYDAASNLTQEVTDGFTTVYAYNPLGLNTNVTTTFGENTIQNHSYTYALSGNVLQKQSTIGTQTNSYAYQYDNAGRLISEQFGAESKTYTYDAFGNRATMTVSGAENYTTAYAYDLNNQLKTETKQIGDISEIWSYQYDNNGNQVSKLKSIIAPQSGEESISLSESGSDYMLYEYDGLNRLKKYTDSTTVATYTYDDQNLRQTKTVNGITTSHIWDGANMVMETAGTDTKKYYRTATGIGYANINGTTQYFHKDGHGDVTTLTDSIGTITKTYTYDAFGTELNTDPTDSNPFRYCGEYFDQETGQIYLRNRYYNSSIGRFITEDPIRDGVNWYAYCGNNPIMFTDPTGGYYILKNADGTYTLKPDTYFNIMIRNVSIIAVSETLTAKAEYKAGRIAGNSLAQDDAFSEGSIEQIRSQFPYFEIFYKLKDAYDGMENIVSNINDKNTDEIAFGLLKYAGISTTSSDYKELDNTIQYTYAFIESLNYFSEGLFIPIFRGETLHSIDYTLSQSKNPQKIINKYYEKTISYFISVGYTRQEAEVEANMIKSELNQYNERREYVFAVYAEYMNLCQ